MGYNLKIKSLEKLIYGDIENDEDLMKVKDIVNEMLSSDLIGNGDIDEKEASIRGQISSVSKFLDKLRKPHQKQSSITTYQKTVSESDYVHPQIPLEQFYGGKDSSKDFKKATQSLENSTSRQLDQLKNILHELEQTKTLVKDITCFINGENPYEMKESLKNSTEQARVLSTTIKKLNNVIERKKLEAPELKKAKKRVTKLIAYEAYAESSPQAILQTYTLWKRPRVCIKSDANNGIKHRHLLIQKLLFSCKSNFNINFSSTNTIYNI